MRKFRNMLALLLAMVLVLGLAACGTSSGETATNDDSTPQAADSSQSQSADTTVITADSAEKADIESALNLANIKPEWTYSENADAWTMAIVTAVTNAELPDYQGVSVCVPGAYVKGVDTDGDGTADATSGTASGNLVVDYDASITSTNGQVYTAATAPVIINTGAAGYSAQSNQTAGTTYAKEGYINIVCGNRGKQSTLDDGTYTGDAPSCLVDQKNAVRFVKYNILLGNLPGSVDYFVSTGGSGGGAHATMLAATSNNPDFYDYEIAAGAVGVYKNDDGRAMGFDLTHLTTVSIYLDGDVDRETEDSLVGRISRIGMRGDMKLRNWLQFWREEVDSIRKVSALFGGMMLLFFTVAVAMQVSGAARRIRSDSRMIGTLRAVGADEKALLEVYRLPMIITTAAGTVLAVILYIAVALWLHSLMADVKANMAVVVVVMIALGVFCALCCLGGLRMRLKGVLDQSIVENIREL
ncbi:MAG: hypothetical protein IKF48_07565 [Oscillospiraceae bacterium]|nr:hypothetical protein [Oscillospiraceae bacterium]